MTNLVRAGLARVTNRPYAPFPTAYDGIFPEGTLLTAPSRPTRVPPSVADKLRSMDNPLTPQAAAAICDHMNDDHADAIVTYARVFAKIADAREARMTGMDRAGMNLDVVAEAGTANVRIPFDHELRDADDARDTLIAMARATAT
ncbi:MAG: hypothetical protein NVSMB5_19510 [Candidatus Velthaea sp.]